jgi:hypothetical protein
MDAVKAVVDFGTAAVLRYRTMSEEPDNRVQEYFLRTCIALGLYERFRCGVQLETLYTDVATSLGVPGGSELTNKIGGCKADIAVFQNGLPHAIIELKILDEPRPLWKVEDDVRKVRRLGEICKIQGYCGVLICQTAASLEEQTHRLERSLLRKVHTGATQISRDGKWQWCFGCCLVSGNQEPEGVGDAP